MTTPLVSFNHLSVSFAGERSRVRAVQEVSFTIQAGQTVGVVGESGCGKSVTAMALMGLLPPQTARIDGGEIRFADRDLLRLKARQMADLRGHQLAMIFQEPMSALNPVLTIGEQLCEPPIRHLGATPKAAWHQAIQLLSEVGLARGDSLMTRYPHQLSGGMLQRVTKYIAEATQSGLLSCVTKASAIMGLMMVGAMSASMVKFTTTFKTTIAGQPFVLQDILDKICVGLIPLLLVLVCLRMLNKKVSPNKILIFLIIFGFAAAGIGII